VVVTTSVAEELIQFQYTADGKWCGDESSEENKIAVMKTLSGEVGLAGFLFGY
jgi:hypothetical protein